ncbi:putative sugar phosphate transporter domain-containing protein [Helianthus anomalus]
MLVLWATKLQPCPKINKSFIIALLGPTLFHTIGHISACVSFSKVAVSFTHVIKSTKPVFSISNVRFVLRSIYSKKSLQNFKQVNGLNLYGWTIASIGTPPTFYLWVLISGVFYHLYNPSSYQALDDIGPLTFSVGNTMKRVVVTVCTVIVFRNHVRPLNALGLAITIFGTFLYSQASSKKKVAVEKKD